MLLRSYTVRLRSVAPGILVALAASCRGTELHAGAMNEPTIEVTAQLWIDAQPGGDTERPLRGSVEIANSSDQRYEITAVRLFFDGRSWEGRAEPTDVSGLWALRDGPERPGRSLVDLEVDLRRSDGEGSVRTVRVAGLTVRIVE